MIINWSECLERANHKAEVAKEILSLLIQELPETVQQVEQLRQQNDSAKLSATIHRLLGGCCYTGVPQLKAAAQSAMDQLRGDQQHLESTLDQLQNSIQILINEYQTIKGNL